MRLLNVFLVLLFLVCSHGNTDVADNKVGERCKMVHQSLQRIKNVVGRKPSGYLQKYIVKINPKYASLIDTDAGAWTVACRIAGVRNLNQLRDFLGQNVTQKDVIVYMQRLRMTVLGLTARFPLLRDLMYIVKQTGFTTQWPLKATQKEVYSFFHGLTIRYDTTMLRSIFGNALKSKSSIDGMAKIIVESKSSLELSHRLASYLRVDTFIMDSTLDSIKTLPVRMATMKTAYHCMHIVWLLMANLNFSCLT